MLRHVSAAEIRSHNLLKWRQEPCSWATDRVLILHAHGRTICTSLPALPDQIFWCNKKIGPSMFHLCLWINVGRQAGKIGVWRCWVFFFAKRELTFTVKCFSLPHNESSFHAQRSCQLKKFIKNAEIIWIAFFVGSLDLWNFFPPPSCCSGQPGFQFLSRSRWPQQE